MPGPRQPPHATALVAGVLCVLFASGCAGARKKVAAKPVQVQRSADGWQREAERRVRRGEHKEAVAALRQARAMGAAGPSVLMYEAVTRWQLRQETAARRADAALARAALARGGAAWSSLERLAAFHIHTRKQPAEAMRLLGPVIVGGCGGPQACELALRVLTRAVPSAGAIATIWTASPRDTSRQRQWRLDLLRELAAATRFDVAAALLDRLLVEHPGDGEVWAAGWYMSRRRRGLQHRKAWIDRVGAAKLSTTVLDSIVASREVATDRLLVAAVLGVMCQRPDANEQHWVRWVKALAVNHVRGAPDSPRGTLATIASEHSQRFVSAESRASLAEALLLVSLPTVAAPWVEDLIGRARSAHHLVLLAELRRQQNRAQEARAAAEEAFKISTNKAGTAWALAGIWRRGWPVDAARWERRAQTAEGQPALETLRQQALQHLDRRRPAPRAENLLRAYLGRLVTQWRAHPAGTAERRRAERWRDELVHVLGDIGRRRRSWRHAAHDQLAAISNSPIASVAAHYQLARMAALATHQDSFLAAWDRAAAAAAATGAPLDRETLLSDVAREADHRLLVRWLRRVDIHEAADLALTWRVAKRLLDGAHKALGRRWMQRALARMAGGDEVLTAGLPRHQELTSQRHGGRSPNIYPRDLQRAAEHGAADLVIEHIEDILRDRPRDRPLDPKLAVDYGRARIAARLARGDVTVATAEARALLRRPSLSAHERGQLLDVLAQHNLCDEALDLAIALASSRRQAVFRQAIRHGTECARRLGDAARAKLLVLTVQRAQTFTASRLQLAQELEKSGYDELAVQIFDAVITGGVQQHAHLLAYARALLDTGRVSQAEGVLRRAIAQHRRRAADYRAAAALLRERGHDRHALLLLSEAQDLHPGELSVRHDLLLLRLAGGDDEGLVEELRDFVRRGPSPPQLKALLNVARAHNRLGLLHRAVGSLVQVDRAVERFRLELAGVLGSRRHVATSVRRLRDRGSVRSHAAVRWLAEVGATREARAMAEDVLASAQPAGGRTGRQERMRILREAMNARLDPNSEEEALGVARLFVGRALETERAATIASEELDRLGFSRAAAAVAQLAGDPANADAHSTCRRGITAWHAGDKARAAALWDNAMGQLMIGDEGQESRARSPALKCLVVGLQRAGKDRLLAQFIGQLLDAQPQHSELWAMLLDVHARLGDHRAAVATLRRAHHHARNLDTLRYMPYARRIRRDGGGPVLAAWFAEDEGLRADPWWLAFVVDVLLDHRGQVGEAGEAAVMGIEALARNQPKLRLELAVMWSARANPAAALKWLGPAPFVHNDRNAVLRQARTSRAAAAVLIAVYRGKAPASVGQEPINITGLNPAGWAAVQAAIEGWRPRLSSEDGALLAGELVSQGHPQLARAVLGLRPPPKLAAEAELTTRQRLRVAATTGTDRELIEAAERYYANAAPGRRGGGPEERQSRLLRHLAFAGRPAAALTLARAFARTGSAAAAAVGVQPPLDPLTASGARFERMVASFDPQVLVRMQHGGPVRSMRDSLAACGLAIAADRAGLAKKWADALVRRHDEPWRVWMALQHHAVSFASEDLAREMLERAERAGAPAGAMACRALWLRRHGKLSDCVARRPVARLPAEDLGDVALAAARGVDAAAVPAVLAALAEAPVERQIAWLGGVSARGWALSAADRARAGQQVRTLLARITPQSRREALVNRALDDMAAVGVAEPGLALTGRLLRARPDDRFARNNASYAMFLGAQPPTAALGVALPALGARGGDEAHALLDTIASSLWAAGHKREARQLQRWALAATRPVGGLSSPTPPEIDAGLPLVRLAEFELEAGRLAEARLLAIMAMQRERLAEAYLLERRDPDEYAATGLPSLAQLIGGLQIERRSRLLRAAGLQHAGTPITMARARAVIAAVLRRQASSARPATPSKDAQ